jgi:hypothetical protein
MSRWVPSTNFFSLETKIKASFVIRGSSQVSDRDYTDTIAPRLSKKRYEVGNISTSQNRNENSTNNLQTAFLNREIDNPRLADL